MTRNRKLAFAVLPLLILPRVWPHPALADQMSLSTSLWSADGELLRVTLASDGRYRLWTPLREISRPLVEAFLLKEDRWFYWHPGANPPALVRAASRVWRGSVRQGGSTITMQLARRLYGLNSRTPTGKLRQILLAFWLETRYSKRDILEAYLNVAPFGGNIEGVGAASRIYFGKPPAEVTLGEALTLAVIPQSPSARGGSSASDAALLKARQQLGEAWLRAHGDNDGDRRQAALAIVARARFALPRLAPHFTDALLRSDSRTGRIYTTLDAVTQHTAERQVERYISEFGDRGIRNAAVLVADPRDMSVKAWIGSADFSNQEISGQVNGVLAKRSPGSTLKPFVYGLALDQGILHPRTILRDAPASYGSFSPEDFDGQFMGPVTAQDALIHSRNIPAMWVAEQLRDPNLYQFLKSTGIRLGPEEHYGLSLVLGGGEITMMELAGLYAMLTNKGMLRPFRTERSETVPQGLRLLSPEASFITLDMLRHNQRPDDEGTIPVRARWPVAWKTGTSWAFRDAWTAGTVGPYVMVVWIGNFDGSGNPSFVGIDAAAPLFFRIADALNLAKPDETPDTLERPVSVKKVAVCALSGDLPNTYCPQTVDTWYIPGKSPIRVSQLHRAVMVDSKTNMPLCPPYSTTSARVQVYEFWPSDMMKMFREGGVPRRRPPVLSDCDGQDSNDAPKILSPSHSITYTLSHADAEKSISLEASVAGDVAGVFWFDGAEFLGRSAEAGGAMSWRPSTDGLHLIRAIDDHGRMAEIDVRLALVQ
jgi:penicillin-binding protein 1C